MTKKKIILFVSSFVVVALAINLIQRKQYSLVDLVQPISDDESQAFIAFATATANELDGRIVVANKVISSMVTPDQDSATADAMTRLLVITEYPSIESSKLAIVKRHEKNHQLNLGLRTYGAEPVGIIQSLLGKALPSTLGLWRKVAVPSSNEINRVKELLNEGNILQGATDQGIYNPVWNEIMSQRGDQQVWMLNFLEFNDQANYGADPYEVASGHSITGEAAYSRYGQGMIGSLAAVGGRVGWSSKAFPELANANDGQWHQIVIAVYPSITAMLTMLAEPEYKAAHVHRVAGLARTRLMVTFPVEPRIN